jgi:hypothetical protein
MAKSNDDRWRQWREFYCPNNLKNSQKAYKQMYAKIYSHLDNQTRLSFLLPNFPLSAKNNTCVVNGARNGLMCEIWSKNNAIVLYLVLKMVVSFLNRDFSYQFSHIVANFDLTKMETFAKKGIVGIYMLWYFIIKRIVVHYPMFTNLFLPSGK